MWLASLPGELIERHLGLAAVGEADDHRLGEDADRAHLAGHAAAPAARGLARRVDAGQPAAQLLVGRELVEQAALQPAAVAEQAAVGQRHVLRLGHLHRDRLELLQVRRAAELAAAGADAVHHPRGVAGADLPHLDARAELAGEIAHEVAEVDAVLGVEVHGHPPLGPVQLDVDHLQRHLPAAGQPLGGGDGPLLAVAAVPVLARLRLRGRPDHATPRVTCSSAWTSSSQSWEYASEMVLKSVQMRPAHGRGAGHLPQGPRGPSSATTSAPGWLSPFSDGVDQPAVRCPSTGRTSSCITPGHRAGGLLGLLLTLPAELRRSSRSRAFGLSLNWQFLGVALLAVGVPSRSCWDASPRCCSTTRAATAGGGDGSSRTPRTALIAFGLVALGIGLAVPLVVTYLTSDLALDRADTLQNHLAVTGLAAVITRHAAVRVHAVAPRDDARNHTGTPTRSKFEEAVSMSYVRYYGRLARQSGYSIAKGSRAAVRAQCSSALRCARNGVPVFTYAPWEADNEFRGV